NHGSGTGHRPIIRRTEGGLGLLRPPLPVRAAPALGGSARMASPRVAGTSQPVLRLQLLPRLLPLISAGHGTAARRGHALFFSAAWPRLPPNNRSEAVPTIPKTLQPHINSAFPEHVCLVGSVLPNGHAQITPRGS